MLKKTNNKRTQIQYLKHCHVLLILQMSCLEMEIFYIGFPFFDL